MKRIIELFLIFCCLSTTIFAQSVSLNSSEIIELTHQVQAKSKKHRIAFLSEYQHNYKYVIESTDFKETKSWVFEQYCLNDGKPFCQMVLLQKDGVAVSKSKIQKERRKAARSLSKSENIMSFNDPSGYGTTMGNVWVDPTVYLRDCQIASFEKAVISERETAVVNVENCNIDREPAEWKPALSFMSKTRATVWIDIKDEGVKQMYIYADKEFTAEAKNNEPLIKMENTRMPEGFWLFKMIRLETIGNEKIFTNLKNNYQYDFFDYKRLAVNVQESKLTAN